ncbi:hypothetical protein BaRGS_00017636, partial [Batillaria attramentaria]
RLDSASSGATWSCVSSGATWSCVSSGATRSCHQQGPVSSGATRSCQHGLIYGNKILSSRATKPKVIWDNMALSRSSRQRGPVSWGNMLLSPRATRFYVIQGPVLSRAKRPCVIWGNKVLCHLAGHHTGTRSVIQTSPWVKAK